MLEEMILAARADKALWLPDLRAAFETEKNASDLILRLHLHRGEILDFSCRLRSLGSDFNRPRTRLILARSKETHQPQCPVAGLDQLVQTG